MLFSSVDFVFFFSITIVFYFILPSRFKWIWLLITSTVFYMYSKPVYIVIPIVLIAITFPSGILIEKTKNEKQKKLIFILTIVAIIGILAFFKYTNFLSSSLISFINFFREKLFASTEPVNNPLLINLIVPLGISYITFQSIGYLVEIYWGNHKAERHIGHFSTYIMFFPKLTMGPIERAHHFLPQLKRSITFNYDNVTLGLKLIAWGLIKKVLIADRIRLFNESIFTNIQDYDGIVLIIASISYTVQLYADFSGYTDIAIGLSKILGFDIIQNFDRPFTAKSITEFWRKWHISLSTWFADYFYNPIVIKKRNWGKWVVIYASMLTFLTLGLWHGANWTYIIFGGFHGIVLTIEFFTRKQRKKLRKKIPVLLNNLVGVLYTFSFFTFTLIFFRATNISQAFYVVKHSITGFNSSMYKIVHHLLPNLSISTLTFQLVFLILSIFLMESFSFSKISDWIKTRPIFIRWSVYFIVTLLICIFGIYKNKEFIYHF